MRTRKGQKKSMKEDQEKERQPSAAEVKKSKQEIMKEKNSKKGISQPQQQVGKKKIKGEIIKERKSNARKSKQKQEKQSPPKERSDLLQNPLDRMKNHKDQEQMDEQQIERRLKTAQQKSQQTKVKVSKGVKLSEQQLKSNPSDEDSKVEQPQLKKEVKARKSRGKANYSKPLGPDQKKRDSQEFFKMIYSKEMINSYLQKMGYDLKKLPVENLSKDTINDAFGILNSLEYQLKGRNDKKKIEELTQEFYEDIPHDFGFSTIEKNLIDSAAAINEKKLLLDSLVNYKTVAAMAPSVIQKTSDLKEFSAKLQRKITLTPPNTQQYDKIKKYLLSTHSQIHKRYTIQLEELYSIKSEQQDKRYGKGLKNKKLLWFGTRLNNISALLCEGFTIPQYDLPVASAPFGKGLYFTDCSSKAANNCYISAEEKVAVLVICEVALGDSAEMYYADPKASKLSPGKNSIKSVGKYSPSAQRNQDLGQAKLPMGPLEPVQKLGTSFLFNEYIVYQVEQVRMKYLLKVRFQDAPQ